MSCCYVEMIGTDGEPLRLTLDAESCFDAAAEAIDRWGRFWWFDPSTIITVRRNDECWQVPQPKLDEWRRKKWPPHGVRPHHPR